MVFGQSDFTSYGCNRGGSVAANTLCDPTGLAVSSNGTLWVADDGNNRILKFNNAHSLSSNGPNADVVLGQPNMTSNATATTQSGLNGPRGLALDESGNLWVADNFNHRILRFNNAASKTNGANADGVLGQPNFTSSTSSTTQNGMSYPTSVAMNGTTLFVADLANHRVLRFDNAASKANGANADGVLGQVNFTSSSLGTTQNKFVYPSGIIVDNQGSLYVAEMNNNRVTIFLNASSKSNGGNADYVLGQPDFSSFNFGTTRNNLYFPGGVSVDNTRSTILVHDSFNNRMLTFHATALFGTTPPSTQDYDITISSIRSNRMDISWTRGSGSGSFVVVRAGNEVTPAEYPMNTTYSSYNNDFSSAPSLGNGKIFYYGTGTGFQLTGLTRSTWYYIRIFGYTGNPAAGTAVYNYAEASNNPKGQRTTNWRLPDETHDFAGGEFELSAINPSPVKDIIKFSLNSPENLNVEFGIYDANGNQVYNSSLIASKGINNVEIPASGLVSGYYALKIKSGINIAVTNFVVTK